MQKDDPEDWQEFVSNHNYLIRRHSSLPISTNCSGLQLKEMPPEARERLKESLYETYEQAASTAATHHRDSNGTRPSRSGRTVISTLMSSRSAAKLQDTDVQDLNNKSRSSKSRVLTSSRSSTRLPSTAPSPITDFLDSEGAHLPRVRTSRSPNSSADSSPSDSSSNLHELQRRAKDILLLREELMKHSIGVPDNGQRQAEMKSTLNPFVENSNSSWANTLREPPPGRRRTTSASLRQGRHKELSEKRRPSTSSDEDKPASKNVDRMSASRTQKYANMAQKYANLAASQSRDVPQKPADADGQPVMTTKDGDIPAIQKKSIRRPSPASKIVVDHTKPSNGTREPPPAYNRQRIQPDSLTRSTTILMPSGAKRRISIDRPDIFKQPEVVRSSSGRFEGTRPGSSDGRNVDLKLDDAGPNNSTARPVRRNVRRDEKSADATRTHRRHGSSGGNLKREDERPDDTHGTHRRLASTGGNLKREHDIANDFPGRGLSESWRHEGGGDSVAGSRRRSSSRKNKDNLKREDEKPADTHGTHRRHASTGRNLKRIPADFPGRGLSESSRHEGEPDSVAGSRRRSSRRNKDNLKREDERPADTHGTHRRHASTGGNLQHEHDIAADFPGRGLSQSSRHEGEADSVAGSRRRSISRNKDNLSREDEGKKGPADTHSTSRRLSGTSRNLKREDDSAADFPGRSLWHEGESDFTASTRRRSSNRNKNFKEENVSVTRQDNSRNLKEESAADDADIHGRHYTTGGNLKQEAGSRDTTNRSWKPDASKRGFSTFQIHRATEDNVGMPLTKVAAAIYNGGSLPFDGMVPFPDDIAGLNKFLDACKREVEAGVTGRNVTVVLGKENSDLDSMVSTIAYAYFLHCKISQDVQYILPVINMRQEYFVQKHEAAWLFKVSGVETSNLIFMEQISLPYYKRFCSLSLVLVDHSKLAPHQEEALQDTVVTIIDHNLPESVYSSVVNLEIEEVGSCCTIIAEKYASEAPEQLAGRGISRLLLGPILLDTTNLDNTFANCTTRDECMAALLIHGAGCYGRQGFFRHLRNLQFDVSHLSTKDALTKEFMAWKLGPGTGRPISAAMSTLGVPLVVMLGRKDIITDLRHFGRAKELDFHLIVTGYFDDFDRYHREILVVPEDNELAQQIVTCFSDYNDELKLSFLRIEGLPEQMLVYKQRQVTASRRVIRILMLHIDSIYQGIKLLSRVENTMIVEIRSNVECECGSSL